MTQSWSVRTYKEGDEHGILELMKLSGSERKSEHWFWKYKNNPYGHLIEVAEHNGQIVGHMALVPTYIKTGDKVTMGSQAVDLMVHPKFRRQGMFLVIGQTLTSDAGKERIDISYGFPNEPAHSGHLKYGWFDVCKVPELIKPINMSKTVDLLDRYRIIRSINRYKIPRNVVKFILQFILAAISFLSRTLNRIEENENIEVRSIESFDDRIDDFWKKVSRDYPLIIIRDKKYLNWRYFEKPNGKYAVLLAEKNEQILGYIILRSRNERELRWGYIVDLLASLEDKTTIQSLILKAVEHFKEDNVDVIVCRMLKNSLSARVYYKILKYNGFIHVSSVPLIARVNSSHLSKEFVEDSIMWYITMGDSDHI